MRIAAFLIIATFPVFSGSISYAQNAQSSVDPRIEQLQNTAPEQLVNEETYTMQWPKIAEREIGWSRRNWAELHLSDPANAKLNSVGTKRENLADALLRAASEGRFKIYSADDDRFTTEMNPAAIKALVQNIPAGAGSNVEKFLLKEDWMYVKTNRTLADRIIGIAPVRQIVGKDGVTTEQTLFWIYYPACREVLRELTWNNLSTESLKNVDELFEMRQFKEQVVSTKEYRIGHDNTTGFAPAK